MTKDFKESEAGKLTLACLSVYALYLIYRIVTYYLQLDGIHVANEGKRLGSDFVNFWAAGNMTLSGEVNDIYKETTYLAKLRVYFGEPLAYHAYPYPPHSLGFLTAFGALPYRTAFYVWTLFGLAVFALAGRAFGLTRERLIVMVLAPASLVCVFGGQTGLIMSALLVGGLSQLERRPVIAGILFGILTIKPQFGVLLALALLCGGHWRAIFSASLTGLIMIVGSVLAFGTDPWVSFFTVSLPNQTGVISYSVGPVDHMVPSAFKWVINLNGTITFAYAVQAVFALGAVLATIWAFRQSADLIAKAALLCVLTLMFSPYVGVYDMPILSFAVMAFTQMRKGAWTVPHVGFLVLVASLPISSITASIYNIPLAPCVLTIFAFIIIREIRSPVGQVDDPQLKLET